MSEEGFLAGSAVKNLPMQGDVGLLDPWIEKIHWRWKWQPIPLFLPWESMDREELVTIPMVSQEVNRAYRLNNNNNVRKRAWSKPKLHRVKSFQSSDTLSLTHTYMVKLVSL